MCVCVCVCACVRAFRSCVYVCMYVCVCMCVIKRGGRAQERIRGGGGEECVTAHPDCGPGESVAFLCL